MPPYRACLFDAPYANLWAWPASSIWKRVRHGLDSEEGPCWESVHRSIQLHAATYIIDIRSSEVAFEPKHDNVRDRHDGGMYRELVSTMNAEMAEQQHADNKSSSKNVIVRESSEEGLRMFCMP